MTPDTKEPIAIIGIGCRFPGGSSSPEKFWEFLKRNGDGMIEVPDNRWDSKRFYDENPERPGKMNIKKAGFLKENIHNFDPLFFNISPREAETLDPQARLVLETSYEVLEDSGIPMEDLWGSDIGVFIGAFTADNELLHTDVLNLENIDSQTACSSSRALLSNRISYFFNWNGPSITIDTACSSSLVTIHYAAQSIWNKECSLALAGGVNAILTPGTPIAMSKGGFLSPDSQSKSFDRNANGYARGEGAGIVALKPLSQAREDNDRIYALIRGTGVNQDGQTSGLTVPNPTSQENLIKQVCKQAGIHPFEIKYIEAHGTGTPTGDPIEAKAINNVLSKDRPSNNSCLLGSVKSNIGHLEAAAGIAGLIKTSLCLHHNEATPNLHFTKLNPAISSHGLKLTVPSSVVAFQKGTNPVYASVNSFGYGGTNAHAILEQYVNTTAKTKVEVERTSFDKNFFVISARSTDALNELAKKMKSFTDNFSEEDTTALLYNLWYRRSHHPNRLCILAKSSNEFASYLDSYIKGKHNKNIVEGNSLQEKRKIVFVFTGMGPQYEGMAVDLYYSNKVFNQKMNECDSFFKTLSGWSIIDILLKKTTNVDITEPKFSQPLNFVIQVALAEMWNSFGVSPDFIVGHSVGEIAASYVSGTLSLHDATLIIYHRSQLQQKTVGAGTMLAISTTLSEAKEFCVKYDDVCIAAINSHSTITLSGSLRSLTLIADELDEKKIFNKRLNLSVPYHSTQMETIKDEFLNRIKNVKPSESTVALFSTVTGTQVQGDQFGAKYWYSNMRQPVRFAKALNNLSKKGNHIYIEIGPHPVLNYSMFECLTAQNLRGDIFPSLKRELLDTEVISQTIASLYCLGVKLDASTLGVMKSRLLKLPQYPWQKKRYWKESKSSSEERFGRPGHVLMNNLVNSPRPTWEVEVNRHFFPFLDDHKIFGATVLPGVIYCEAGFAIGNFLHPKKTIRLDKLKFNKMLQLDANRIQRLHITVNDESGLFEVHSRYKEDEPQWQSHASGYLVSSPKTAVTSRIDLVKIIDRLTSKQSKSEFYKNQKVVGFDYGPYFQSIQEVSLGDQEVLAKISIMKDFVTPDFILNPAIMDAAFQAWGALRTDDVNPNPYVPVSVDSIIKHQDLSSDCLCYCKVISLDNKEVVGDIYLVNDKGELLVSILKLRCSAIRQEEENIEQYKNWIHNFDWVQRELEEITEPIKVYDLLVVGEENVISEFSSLLESSIDHLNSEEKKPLNESFKNIVLLTSKQLSEQNLDFIQSFKHLVYIPSPQSEESNGVQFVDKCLDDLSPLLNLVKLLHKSKQKPDYSLMVLTVKGQVLLQEKAMGRLSQSCIWGLARTIATEFEEIKVKLVDLDSLNLEMTYSILREFANWKLDEEVAYRRGIRYVKMLEKSLDSGGVREEVTLMNPYDLNDSYELILNVRSKKEVLGFMSYEDNTKENLVEVTTSYAGILFPDTKELPKAAIFTGTVTDDLDNNRVGNKVICYNARKSITTKTKVPKEHIFPLSDNIDLKEASALTPLTTAYQTLIYQLQLVEGSEVYINNPSSPEGWAFIQVADQMGMKIRAETIDEEIYHRINEKRKKLNQEESNQEASIDTVILVDGSKESNDFWKFVSKNTTILDFRSNPLDALSISYLTNMECVNYQRTNFCELPFQNSDLFLKSLRKILENLHQFDINASEINSTNKNDFYMNRNLDFGHVPVYNLMRKLPFIGIQKKFNKNGTYIIVGGTSGFGLEIARWLAQKGVKRIAICSRSGSNNSTLELINEFSNKINVTVDKVDVTNYDSVQEFVTKINKEGPGVKGVFHCAMVLDDKLVINQSRTSMKKVLLPKIAGAINLHQATIRLNLDCFVLCGSVSSIVGNLGQANYNAANAFLDEFSVWRNNNGYSSLTVSLGAISDTGVISKDQKLQEIIADKVINPCPSELLLKAIEMELDNEKGHIGIFDVDWQSLFNTTKKRNSKYNLISKNLQTNTASNDSKVVDILNTLDPEGRVQYLTDIIVVALSEVLKIPQDNIDPHQSLQQMGIDSMLTVEFLSKLRSNGLNVGIMDVLQGKNSMQLIDLILSQNKLVNEPIKAQKVIHNDGFE